jgi:hypothetical protein
MKRRMMLDGLQIDMRMEIEQISVDVSKNRPPPHLLLFCALGISSRILVGCTPSDSDSRDTGDFFDWDCMKPAWAG